MTNVNLNIKQALQLPFHPNDIEWRVQRENRDGSSVLVLAYVTNRAIQARLDEVFTPFGWQNTFHEGPQGGLICRIGALSGQAGWVWKEDGAENTQVEAVKGGISSAMKRAAVQWGVGRYLYKLTDNWAKLQDKKPAPNSQGQQAGYHKGKYWATPQLPTWALPETALANLTKAANQRLEAVQEAPNEDDMLTDGMKKSFWHHIKAHWDDDQMRKDVYQQAFDLFGQGDNMKISVYQTACKWVTETSKRSQKDPIADKLAANQK
tara:strand:+ start:3098 stop:3889 length:792 start_codon:yes stop_codon:yes gene_type:complete